MNSIFLDCLNNFITAFIDDLLIYSKNRKEYKLYIKTILQRLRDIGL
jgi:hypothetical protein